MPASVATSQASLKKERRIVACGRSARTTGSVIRKPRKEAVGTESDFVKLAGPYKGMLQGPRDLSTRVAYGG